MKPRANPPPAEQKPQRHVAWLWRNEPAGYGVLVITLATPKGAQRTEYFAQAVKGPRGRVWRLAKLAAGVGIEAEYTVDLVGAMCECDGFKYRNRCLHLDGLSELDHHGRL